MKPRSLMLSAAAPTAAAVVSLSVIGVLRPATALSMFGFWPSANSDSSAEDAKARAEAVALIRENAAADEFVPPALGVGRTDAARFEAARSTGKLVCDSRRSSDSSGGSPLTTEVPWDRINDNFCDCPYDGSDEPGTSACSNGTFECVNRGHRSIRLPSSRVGDGVCDCCDGSDEPQGVCGADCAEASEAWVSSLADRLVKVEKGTARRAEYVQVASEADVVRTREIEDTRVIADTAREKLTEAKEALKALEDAETLQRNAKLAEAERAVSEATGNVLDDPDRLAALAIAVASSEEPAVTLETLARFILDGMDVGDALNALLDGGKKAAEKAKGNTKGPESGPDQVEKKDAVDEFLEDDGDIGYDDIDDPYDHMPLDDDYGGYYGDYHGGYGDDYGDFEAYDDYLGHDVDTAAAAADGISSGADGVDVPVPDLESHPEDKDEVTIIKPGAGRGDGGAGGEVMEGEQDGLTQPEAAKTAPFKPPRQFKTFKFETPEAVEGRKKVKNFGDDVKQHEKKLKTLEQEASADYGPDGALLPLKDKCVSAKAGGYEYRVCPFKDAHQEEKKSKTLIGKWKGIERAEERPGEDNDHHHHHQQQQHILSGDVLVFDRGQKCWNGPSRSLRVSMACGPDDVLSSVAEPETCTYTAVMESPAVCSPALRDSLIGSSMGGGGRGGVGPGDAVVGGEGEL